MPSDPGGARGPAGPSSAGRLYTSHEGWSEDLPGARSVGARGVQVPPTSLSPRAAPLRYRDRGVVGAGGMGEVHVALDQHLGREVAHKILHRDTPHRLREALAREARITARLEHPGIVPVYDAGTSADGEPWYTMRLIRGRSLWLLLTEATTPAARQALLRPFLAVCEAVAYAHAQRVVHRDLKPSNVMLGSFGEVQVVDWGLAVELDEAEPPPARAPAGTAAYMSPEQAEGAAPDPRDDVYSLGAMLHELVTGRPLYAEATPEAVLERLRARRLDLSALDAPGVPRDLATIVRTALALRAAYRYPEAGALAADLLRYLDGGRVGAHEYKPTELLLRAVRALRVPLGIAAAAAALGAVGLALGVAEVRDERARAVAAEQVAVQARQSSDALLDFVLESEAVDRHARDEWPEAEVIAAHALARTGSPSARGVLAATVRARRALVLESPPVPACARWVATSTQALCLSAGHAEAFALGGGAPRWAVSGAITDAVPLRRAVALVFADAHLELRAWADGRLLARHPIAPYTRALVADASGEVALLTDDHDVWVARAGPASIRAVSRPCGFPVIVDAVGAYGDTLVLACRDLMLRQVGLDGVAVAPPVAVRPGDKPASAVAVTVDGRRAAVGGLGGDVVEVDLARGEPCTFRAAQGAIRGLRFVGRALAVRAEQQAVALWSRCGEAELARLPRSTSGTLAGTSDVLVAADTRVVLARLAAETPPVRLHARAGVASVAVHPGRGWVAAGDGSGDVTVWSTARGERVAALDLSGGVIKRVSFSPSGGRLAAAISGDIGSALVDTTTWTLAPHVASGRGLRRLAHVDEGTVVGAYYGEGLGRWSAGSPGERVPTPQWVDLLAYADGVVGLTREGCVVTLDARGTLGALADCDEGAESLGASPTLARLALGHSHGVRVRDRARGAVRWLTTDVGRVLSVAVSPDGRWVAATGREGAGEVFDADTGRRVAVLRGHRETTPHVVFGADGTLYTGSWDGTVRAWDVATLSAEPEALVAEAERAWGLTLADALRGQVP